MRTANRTKHYKVGDEWYVDAVPVGSRSYIEDLEFLGIGQRYEHRFKNGNTEPRWKLVNSIGPEDEVWFILEAFVRDAGCHNLVVKMCDETIYFEWLTEKNMRASQSHVHSKKLCTLDVAFIEAIIEEALAGCKENK